MADRPSPARRPRRPAALDPRPSPPGAPRRDADPSGMLAGPSPATGRDGGPGQPPDTRHRQASASDDPTAPTGGPDRVRTGSAGPTSPTARLGIRELRGQLTSLVRRAGTGERIVVTIAGRPIAQLGPVEPASAQVTIDDLVARGLLEPARRGDRPADPGVIIDSWTGRRLDHALREVRGA